MVTFKKIALLAFIALMMVGCDLEDEYDESPNDGMPFGYTYLVLDSCEYISGYNQLAHKGNCSFCKERDSIKWEKRKKELKEFVEQLNKK